MYNFVFCISFFLFFFFKFMAYIDDAEQTFTGWSKGPQHDL